MSNSGDAKRGGGFNLTPALNLVVERQQWLVDGLLLEVGLSLLVGKSKVGKSLFARQLAYSVAEGIPFLGRQVRQGDALYLNLEGPEDLIKEHLVKLGYEQKNGAVFVVSELMPFRGDEGLHKLAETLIELPDTRLIIVDPAHKFLRVLDSHKYDDVSLSLEKLEALAKQFRVQVLMLHHAKKLMSDDIGDSSLGSTAYRAGTSTNLFMLKRGANRFMESEQRRGTPLEQTHLVFDPEREALSLGAAVSEEQKSRSEQRKVEIRERITQELWLKLCVMNKPTQNELLGLVKGKTELKLSVLQQLVTEGRVAQFSDGPAKRYEAVVRMEGAA